MYGAFSLEHPWEVRPNLSFYRHLEEFEKEEQAAAGSNVTKEEFQGKWTSPAPEFLAAQPKVPAQSEGVQAPLCPSSSSLLKTRGPSQLLKTGLQPLLLRLLNEEEQPLSSLTLFFHKVLDSKAKSC